jgi:hypothetical protein
MPPPNTPAFHPLGVARPQKHAYISIFFRPLTVYTRTARLTVTVTILFVSLCGTCTGVGSIRSLLTFFAATFTRALSALCGSLTALFQ